MSTNATHPNPQLHNLLLTAAKEHKLDAEFIKKAIGGPSAVTIERDASAYVNWNTTLTLLGRAPAKIWFAGVSLPIYDKDIVAQPRDQLRDDLSVGTYYWWAGNSLPATSYFEVVVFKDENVLFIDVFDGAKVVAVFDGTPTMNVQIQGGHHQFVGEGRWGRAK